VTDDQRMCDHNQFAEDLELFTYDELGREVILEVYEACLPWDGLLYASRTVPVTRGGGK